MDITSGVQDVNITIPPAPSLAITVAADTTISMPITGVGGLKGDKGDTGATGAAGSNAPSDHTLLSNIGTNTHAQIDTALTRLASTSGSNTGDQDLSGYATTSSVTTGLATKANTSHTHSQADVSSLVSDLASKQATLVSGTNIKTINGSSLLGSGDLAIASGGGSGTVTSVSSADANATVATGTTTPVITVVAAPKLTTARTINGVSFDGTANITVADSTKEPTITAGTTAQYWRGDKSWQTLPTTATPSGAASGDLSGTYPSPTVAKINGTALSGLATGILKNTTTTGVPSIAIAADFPTLNQSTTGSAATLTTGRTIAITGDLTYTSPSFNGSANVTAAGTLATVNANTGSFGTASSVPTITLNGKGLATAAANTAIQITESQVTNLTTDLAAKQATLTLTTTGTSGAATLTGATLNIPQYAGGSAADATTTTKGIVQLAGDLAGTAAAPTVPGLSGKEPTITAGTTAQYYRGDKTFQTLDKTAVGLANVDNTSDATKNSATATLTNKTLTAPVINNPTGFLTGTAKITTGTVAPSSPTTGDLWIDTN